MKNKMLTGTRDTNLLVLENLNDRDLLSYCQTNRYAQNLCKNEDFWRNRFIKVYGGEAAQLKDRNRTWKDFYLLILYYTSKYTQKKALEKVAEKGYKDLFPFLSKGLNNFEIKNAIIESGNKDLIYNLENIPDQLKRIGIRVAAKRGDRDLIQFLSKGDPKYNYLIIEGAVKGNQQEIFAEYDKKQNMSYVLPYASYSGNINLMKLFIERGDKDINFALRHAAVGHQKEAINFLIKQGANDWENGLKGAAEGGHNDLIDFFISKGAKITRVVLSAAEAGGYKETITYLEKLKKQGK
jgi:hypothetical protein